MFNVCELPLDLIVITTIKLTCLVVAITFTGKTQFAVRLLVIQEIMQVGEHFSTVATNQYVWIA